MGSDRLVARFGALVGVTDRVVGLDDVTAPVVVGCSGGPDSLTLLAVAVDRELDPIAVHVDHGVRDGSDAESAIVADAARAARRARRSPEGRRGDRREPRGARPRGSVRGAASRRGRAGCHATCWSVTRPTTRRRPCCWRSSEGAARRVSPGWRSGATGSFDRSWRCGARTPKQRALRSASIRCATRPTRMRSYRRAWIRHVALPLLSTGASRDLVPVLARQANVLREESAYLDALARAAWPPDPDDAVAASLAQLPGPLGRRAVRCWLGPPPPSFDEVERVLAVARGEARATQLAGGRCVRRTRGRLVVDQTGPPSASRSAG